MGTEASAVLAKRDAVSMPDLEEARDKVRYGRQKISRKLEEEDRKITAYHEAGHAVVAIVMGLEPVSLSVEEDGDSYGRVAYPAHCNLGKFREFLRP